MKRYPRVHFRKKLRELKEKVESFVDENPIEAVRLIRFFIQTDFESSEFKF